MVFPKRTCVSVLLLNTFIKGENVLRPSRCLDFFCFVVLKSKNSVTLQENRTFNINTQMVRAMLHFWVEGNCGALEFGFASSDHLGGKHTVLPFPGYLVNLASIKQDILGDRPFQLPQWSCVSRLLVYKHGHLPV